MVFAGAVTDTVPSAKLSGTVRSVHVVVGNPLASVSHNCAVKPVLVAESVVLVAETMSTPVRVYPASFEPVVNPCDKSELVLVSPSAD